MTYFNPLKSSSVETPSPFANLCSVVSRAQRRPCSIAPIVSIESPVLSAS